MSVAGSVLVVDAPAAIVEEVRHAIDFVVASSVTQGSVRRIDVQPWGRSVVRCCLDDEPLFEAPVRLLCALDANWLAAGSGPSSVAARLPVADLRLDAETRCILRGDVVVLDGAIDGSERAGNGDHGNGFASLRDSTATDLARRLDLLGSIFWITTRYEEVVTPDRDERDRHRAAATLAHRAALHERALADEWAAIFAAAMCEASGGRLRRRNAHRVALVPTHDIDVPFLWRDLSFTDAARRTLGGLIMRRDWHASAIMAYWAATRAGFAPRDPYATFDELMRAAESIGVSARFYFTADDPADPAIRTRHDPLRGRYDVADERLAPILRAIHERSHIIGLHPCAGAHRDGDILRGQKDRLENAMRAAGVDEPVVEGRHHYLQWDARGTPRLWEEAGMRLDSTLGWAEHAGFRCGTGATFAHFDLVARRPLAVAERPLVAMDVTLLDAPYMALSPADAVRVVARLTDTCARAGHGCTILWHNSRLVSGVEREPFETILALDRRHEGDPSDRIPHALC